ncbi:MAG TPA: N-6 DNA methylase, partial [Chloroflexota bacterium]
MQLAVGAGRLSNDLSLDGLYHWSDAVLVSEVTARLDELNHLLGGGALIATPGLVNDPEGAAPHDRPFGSQGWAGTRVRLLPAHGRTENAPVLLAPLSLPDGAALRSVVQVAARDGVSGARWPVLSAAYESLLRYAPADGDGSEPLVLQRSDHHCRRYGSFYTGHALARSVVEAALAPLLPVTGVPSSHLSILDPAMGTGIFLVETVRALVDRGIATGAEVAATWLHGYDVDPV